MVEIVEIRAIIIATTYRCDRGEGGGGYGGGGGHDGHGRVGGVSRGFDADGDADDDDGFAMVMAY